jgi:hypothetical protein
MTSKEQTQLTREAESGPASSYYLPEFANSATAQRLTGLCRSHLYALQNEGKIRSACLRKPGAIRGKRAWHIPSILAFLRSQMESEK